MTESQYKNRWYDKDPTVSMAISILRNADKEKQLKVAEYILDKLETKTLNKTNLSQSLLKVFKRRWYDYDKKLSTAMECLHLSSLTIQQDLALDVIDMLCDLDSQTPCESNQSE